MHVTQHGRHEVFKTITAVLLMSAAVASLACADDAEVRSLADVLASLESSNYQVRRKAVLAVEGRSESVLLDRVLAMAKNDPHPNIRGYCAQVLGTFDDPRVFDVLAAMAAEATPGPREHALVALGRLGDVRAYPILLKALDAGRGVRGYAARGLGLLGDRRAFEPVASMYAAHLDDPYLNDMAPEALVLLDEQRGLALLRKSFTTVVPVARWGIARVLARHPAEATRELMLNQLHKGGDEALRNVAIYVLAELADPKSLEGVLQAFRDHPASWGALAGALGRIGDKRAVSVLLPALRASKIGSVKNQLIAALGRIGDRRAVATLMPFLDDPMFVAQDRRRSSISGFPLNMHVRGVALWAVRKILDGKEPFALETLVRFPERPAGKDVANGIAKLKTWWPDHEKDEAFRIEGD